MSKKEKQTKTAVVCPIIRSLGLSASFDEEKRMEEAEGLVRAMGQTAVFVKSIKLDKPTAGLFFGKGTVEKLKSECLENEVELVVVDGALSPVQQRNLEKALELKVIDRTAVILEIFGRRAQTKEGKLQVELAHLSYQKGRLVRSWTHLERQRGGGGFLGGPGETQIELDKRHLGERILKIKKELEKVKKTRSVQRLARKRVPYPHAAFAGYTNAGKSTLFNFITKAQVMAEDMLFATLDPTMRKVEFGAGREIILSDTVGFISDLPHELVMAFRATLEEVLEADVIVHVIDVSNPLYKKQRADVLEVLHELGLEKIEFSKRYIEVYNKIDCLSDEGRALVCQNLKENRVGVSALTGEGVADFLAMLEEKLFSCRQIKELRFDVTDGAGIAKAYRLGKILERREDGEKVYLRVLEKNNFEKRD